MPKFILEIELGSDAMKTNFDVGSKLMGIGNAITYSERCNMAAGTYAVPVTIRDFNGNVVGQYEVRE